ncbi:MAG: tRNA (adenosine(37)-N6)-threonylcarbamoyltransferase complex transferase subunit TsaD, partial [Neisseriaceae bacterium]|nr:tRNA (adenosine(37)-N6)-threonylcarbamoyltransferase complex transferase subunit TsaD [Neisseriaceae bacterium]
DICRAFQNAVVDVLYRKVKDALKHTGLEQLIVAGGVGANMALRAKLKTLNAKVFFPQQQWCTDNGAMIAYAAAQHLQSAHKAGGFTVKPRWNLATI